MLRFTDVDGKGGFPLQAVCRPEMASWNGTHLQRQAAVDQP